MKSQLAEIEGYPDFPLCLDVADVKSMIEEEELCRMKFGYKKMTDDVYEDFVNTYEFMWQEPERVK